MTTTTLHGSTPVDSPTGQRVIDITATMSVSRQTRHYPGHRELDIDLVRWEDTGRELTAEEFDRYEAEIIDGAFDSEPILF